MDADFAPSDDSSTSARNVLDSYLVHIEDEWPDHQSWSDDDLGSKSGEESEDDENDQETMPTQQSMPCDAGASPPLLTLDSSRSQPTHSSFNPSCIPPSRFYSKAPKPTVCGRDMEAYIRALENEVSVLHQENKELATHTVLTFDQLRGLKHRLNGKTSK